ncbi:hypothetical protein HK099_008090 [Clydaea vesicula]|uniref:Glycosyltransferase n=1 Tax=Clydaea vesicula TaxID=447962 RepID=A0AAD5U0J0_9FUNG|nr:hypothetical protein HK099_008090 [Clydaea vesicula]
MIDWLVDKKQRFRHADKCFPDTVLDAWCLISYGERFLPLKTVVFCHKFRLEIFMKNWNISFPTLSTNVIKRYSLVLLILCVLLLIYFVKRKTLVSFNIPSKKNINSNSNQHFTKSSLLNLKEFHSVNNLHLSNSNYKEIGDNFKGSKSKKYKTPADNLNLHIKTQNKKILREEEDYYKRFKNFPNLEWYIARSYLENKYDEQNFFSSNNCASMINKFKEEKKKVEDTIPKIIHQIWITSEHDVDKPLPTFSQVENCKKINNDFKFMFWTNNNISQINLVNKAYFNIWRNTKDEIPGATDILRYEILYQFGGIYMDIDTICVKPFNDLVNKSFFIGYEMFNNTGSVDPTNPMIANGVIGSKKQNFFFYLIKQYFKSKTKKMETAWIETGPAFLTRFLKMFNEKFFKTHEQLEVLDYKKFYPFHHSEANSRIYDQGRELRYGSYCMPTQWGNVKVDKF